MGNAASAKRKEFSPWSRPFHGSTSSLIPEYNSDSCNDLSLSANDSDLDESGSHDDYKSHPVDLRDSDQDSENDTAHQTPESLIPQEILNMDKEALDIYRMALKKGKEKVHNIRIMIVGPCGVGKTTLTKRLLNLDFNMEDTESTNGVDIHVRKSFISIPDRKWIFGDGLQVESSNCSIRLGRIFLSNLQAKKSIERQGSEDTHSEESFIANARQTSVDEKQVSLEYQKSTLLADKTQTLPLDADQPVPRIDKSCSEIQEESVYVHTSESDYKNTNNSSSNGQASRSQSHQLSDLQEVVKCIQENDQQLTQDLAEISFWDFGGQFVFYSTHQAFLSPRAIYLLVMDITKGWKDVVEDDECFVDISGCKYLDMGEYIIFWLNSIHTYGSGSDDDRGCPPVILVATHIDELPSEELKLKIRGFFYDIRTGLRHNRSIFEHLADEDFAINNKIQDPQLEDLRLKIFEIACSQRNWGEEIPANWITLEKALSGKKVQGQNILSFGEIIEVDKSGVSPISDQEEIKVFLRFHNSLGNLIYFNEENLNDWIILEPQWLVNAFKCLITAETFCLKNWKKTHEWFEFNKHAILRQELADAVWNQAEDNSYYDHRYHLLALMQKMDIIAKPVNEGQDEFNQSEFYYVPCMLKQTVTEDYLSTIFKEGSRTSYFCHVFENKFLPPAVFHRLVSALVSKWHVACQGKKRLIFCGCAIFDLNKHNRLVICMHSNVIQISVYRLDSSRSCPDPELCMFVKHFINDALLRITNRFQQHLPWVQHIKCSLSFSDFSSIEGVLSVDDLLSHQETTCHGHDRSPSHQVDTFKLLKYWFTDDELKHLQVDKSRGCKKYDFLVMHGKDPINIELASDLKETINAVTGREDSAIIQRDFDKPGEQELSIDRYFKQCRYIVIIVEDKEGVDKYKQQLAFLESLNRSDGRVIPAVNRNLSKNHEEFRGVNPLDLDDLEHCKTQIRNLLS